MVGISPSSLKAAPVMDLAIRFAFGVTVSATAAVISTVWGYRLGGLFLAFPAILPATLSLIEKENSKREAKQDDVGAVLGATALFGFAGGCWLLISRVGAAATLACAAIAWVLVAVALYVLFRKLRARSRATT